MKDKYNNIIELKIHYYNLVLSSIIADVLILKYNAASYSASCIGNHSNGIVCHSGWLLIFFLVFFLIFSIISTLYFVRSLSETLHSSFEKEYFWPINLVLSIILTNIIYIYLNHNDHFSENITTFLQIYSFTILDIYCIYFCLFTCGVHHVFIDLIKMLIDYLIEDLVNQTLVTMFQLIFNPFNIIVVCIISILKYNPFRDNNIYLPGMQAISLNATLTGISIIDNIFIFICVIIFILLASLIGELFFEIFMLGIIGYRYTPVGVSKKLRSIILGFLIPFIKSIFESILGPIYSIITQPLFLPYSITQAIIIPSIWRSEYIDTTWKVIIIFISLITFSIFFCFLKPENRLETTGKIMKILFYPIGFSIIAIFAALLFNTILNYHYIYIIVARNIVPYGFICISISLLLLITFLSSLNNYNLPVIVLMNGNLLMDIKINPTRLHKGRPNMKNEYQVSLNWHSNKKMHVLFAVDSSAAMLRFSDQGRMFSSEIVQKIQERLNLKENGDKNGLVCWRNEPIEKDKGTIFSAEKNSIITNLKQDITIKGHADYDNIMTYVHDLCKDYSDIDYIVALITNGFVEDNKVLYYNHKTATDLFSKLTNIQIYTIGINFPQQTVVENVLKPLAELTDAEYIQIDEKNKIDESLEKFVGYLGFDFEITISLPNNLDYVTDSANSAPEIEKESNNTLLKWNLDSLHSEKEIEFKFVSNCDEGKICKKPELKIASNYSARYGRDLSFNQKIKKLQ